MTWDHLIAYDRCDADPNDLDNPNATLRTREQATTLLRDLDPESLWYKHGIVPDFQVCHHSSGLQHGSNKAPQPFMMRFPCADIYELLTFDLLHQAIKGAFQDHLVQWVEDYLKLIHGPSKAEGILDEIDRWFVRSQIFQNMS